MDDGAGHAWLEGDRVPSDTLGWGWLEVGPSELSLEAVLCFRELSPSSASWREAAEQLATLLAEWWRPQQVFNRTVHWNSEKGAQEAQGYIWAALHEAREEAASVDSRVSFEMKQGGRRRRTFLQDQHGQPMLLRPADLPLGAYFRRLRARTFHFANAALARDRDWSYRGPVAEPPNEADRERLAPMIGQLVGAYTKHWNEPRLTHTEAQILVARALLRESAIRDSWTDVATLLDIAPGTVHTLTSRVRGRLRQAGHDEHPAWTLLKKRREAP